jgi:serine/threonine protein kinase
MPSIEKRILEREVKAIKKLCGPAAHPNIVQVVDHGLLWSCDFYYIDMELCNMSLDDYLHPKHPPDASTLLPCFVKGGGSDSLVQMWTIMSQIARGVDYIHRLHKIHRDIKPANSMTLISGKVTDLFSFVFLRNVTVETRRFRVVG